MSHVWRKEKTHCQVTVYVHETEDKRYVQLFDNKRRYEFNIYNFLFDPTLVFARNLFENMGSAAELRVI